MVLVTEAVRGSLRDIMSAPQHPQHQQPHTTAGQGHGYGGGGGGSSGHGDQGAAEGGAAGAAATAGGGLSCLEVKLGLLAVAEALTFLHSAAKLAHCGLSPQVCAVLEEEGGGLQG